MNKNIILSFVLIVILLISQTLSGQGFDANSMGMGGAYSAVARGVNSVTWNPANLALPRTGFFELNFFGLNLNIGNSSFTIDNYKRYFTQAGHDSVWSDEDIENILALIPDDGFNANLDINANALGVAIGPYALSAQVIAKAQGIIPKSAIELMLLGNLKEKYTFNDIDGDGYSAVKITLSGAHPIKIKRYFDTFTIGANLNYYRAIVYSEITEARGYSYTGLEYLESDVLLTGRIAEGGSGFGVDIGAAGIINKKLSVSLSLLNTLGSITWNDKPQKFIKSFVIDSADITNIDLVETDTTFDIDAFSTRLPVVLRMGVAYDIRKHLTLALDLQQAFSSGMGYSDQAKISIGAEYRPTPIVPIRAGFTFGGKWGFAMGLGIGFHMKALQFDFAYTMHRALLPGFSKGMSFGMGIKIAI